MSCIMFAAGLTGGYLFSPFIPEAIFWYISHNSERFELIYTDSV